MSGERLISIVDDDCGIRLALQELMRSASLAAEAFASAEDFLQSGRLDRTACLVLDVKLPKMSGLELQKHLAAAGVHIPIVFMTAHEEDESRAEALESGAAAFFSKPLNGGVLLGCLRAIVKP